MSRVIAGKARGRSLEAPEGLNTRPTTDRNKEALFGMIQFQLDHVRFLDLYAGSGQIGIEALSRGASFCDFVERAPAALKCLRGNLERLGMKECARVWPVSVERAIACMARDRRQFDIIFMDPPYHEGLESQTGLLVMKANLLSPDGLLLTESASDTDVEVEGLVKVREKTYKTTRFSFFRLPGT